MDITFAEANDISGNSGAKEVWLVSDTSSTFIGTLTAPDDSLFHVNTFTLPTELYSSISGSSWNIGFRFNESTGGTDTFYLDKSRLYGDYTAVMVTEDNVNGLAPVPEPATMLLLGSGLIGLAGFRRKFRKS